MGVVFENPVSRDGYIHTTPHMPPKHIPRINNDGFLVVLHPSHAYDTAAGPERDP